MTLFMAEVAVSDFAASVAWYRDVLGLAVEKLDPANGFALLGRVALRVGTPAPGGVRLHFAVPNLDADVSRLAAAGIAVESVKASDEGYRRAVVRDPDGYAVSLFQWADTR